MRWATTGSLLAALVACGCSPFGAPDAGDVQAALQRTIRVLYAREGLPDGIDALTDIHIQDVVLRQTQRLNDTSWQVDVSYTAIGVEQNQPRKDRRLRLRHSDEGWTITGQLR